MATIVTGKSIALAVRLRERDRRRGGADGALTRSGAATTLAAKLYAGGQLHGLGPFGVHCGSKLGIRNLALEVLEHIGIPGRSQHGQPTRAKRLALEVGAFGKSEVPIIGGPHGLLQQRHSRSAGRYLARSSTYLGHIGGLAPKLEELCGRLLVLGDRRD